MLFAAVKIGFTPGLLLGDKLTSSSCLTERRKTKKRERNLPYGCVNSGGGVAFSKYSVELFSIPLPWL
jgi:hypothetical protein